MSKVTASILLLIVLAGHHVSFADQKASPNVLSVTPYSNQLNVLPSGNISVSFDMEMDPSSFDSTSFVVTSAFTGYRTGTISYDGHSNIAIFDPTIDFHAGEQVSVTLTTGIRSSQGTPMESGYVWTFIVAVDGGDGTFIQDSTYSVGNSPSSAVAADLDNDGNLDLAISNQLDNDVHILANVGTAQFAPLSTGSVGSNPLAVVAADFDRDADLDVAAVNSYSGDVSILMNHGDGSFAVQTAYPAGSLPQSICTADLDGDGYLDLAVANTYSHNASVMINDGIGGFSTVYTYPLGQEPWCIAVSDLDNDGDIDIASANDVSFDVSVLLNNGDGSFGSQATYPVGHKPVSLIAADLDGDGDADIATANDMSDNVTVLINDGGAGFAVQGSYSVAVNPVAICTSDFDGDGDLDIATACWGSDRISILINNGNGTFAGYSDHPAVDNPGALFPADLDGDGDVDLITANAGSDNVAVMLNEVVCFDSDGDGYGDPGHPENECPDDNCAFIYNPSQTDFDDDGVGDICDICPEHPADDCCDPIGSNRPPQVTSAFADTVMPGNQFVYVATATDADCDGTELVLTFESLPSWCETAGDTVTGWVECDYNDTSFVIRAFDGAMGSFRNFSLTVDKSNIPPQIEGSNDHAAVQIGNTFEYYPDIIDPDDSTHSVTYLTIPGWCTLVGDTVSGTAPDSISAEPIEVIVADYCHADTASIQVETYLCGDVDASLMVDIDDVIFLISYIFLAGISPQTVESGDPNCSGEVDIDDMVYLLTFIFLGGDAPCAECP